MIQKSVLKVWVVNMRQDSDVDMMIGQLVQHYNVGLLEQAMGVREDFLDPFRSQLSRLVQN